MIVLVKGDRLTARDLVVSEGKITISDTGYGGECALSFELDEDEVDRVCAALEGEEE